MSWIPAFTNPWWWALLASVPVGIILLYFLKLRREPVEVPSTFLWARTIEDLHVNSLLQRLRRSLLLLLQLLAIALAVLALFQPGLRGETSDQNRMVFLLDNSASMQTEDGAEGRTRFESAKRLIEQRIEAMADSDVAMLVTFNDQAETVQSFTSDRRRLRAALDRVEVTNQTTDILDALKAADGLANPRRSSELGDVMDVQVADEKPAELLIFSDGGFQPVTEFSLGHLEPRFIPLGEPNVRNLAITAFSAERNLERPTEVQAFATVVNTGDVALATAATLQVNGEFFDAAPVELEPGEQTGLSFTLESEQAATLELTLDDRDDFVVDNVGYAGLTPMRNVSVLVVTAGNTPLRLGLQTPRAAKICQAELVSPDFLNSQAFADRAAAGVDDLIIFDRCSPKQMPLTNTFFIGALPPNDESATTEDALDVASAEAETSDDESSQRAAGWQWVTPESSVVLVDVNRTHPLMRYLELFSLLIFSGRGLEGPPGATELVSADIGTVMAVAPRDGYQDLVLGFEIISASEEGTLQANTNWYTERSWPVFILNVLRYLAGAAEAAGAPSYQPGETVRLRLESAFDEVEVRRATVAGQAQERPLKVEPGPSGIVEIVETAELGNYRVEGDGQLLSLYSINLFDRTESEIAAKPSIDIGYEAIAATDQTAEGRHEYWRLALIGMLGLLAAEWWVYTRRVS